MREVHSALEGADHIRQVILEIRAVGACAEGHAVVRIVDHLHHALDVCLVDEAGKVASKFFFSLRHVTKLFLLEVVHKVLTNHA